MRFSVRPSVNLLTLSHAWNRSDVLDEYKKKGHFSLFLLEAMSRGPLPRFEYQGRRHPLQKPRGWYGKFDQVLKEYYRRNREEILKGSRQTATKEAKQFPGQLND